MVHKVAHIGGAVVGKLPALNLVEERSLALHAFLYRAANVREVSRCVLNKRRGEFFDGGGLGRGENSRSKVSHRIRLPRFHPGEQFLILVRKNAKAIFIGMHLKPGVDRGQVDGEGLGPADSFVERPNFGTAYGGFQALVVFEEKNELPATERGVVFAFPPQQSELLRAKCIHADFVGLPIE